MDVPNVINFRNFGKTSETGGNYGYQKYKTFSVHAIKTLRDGMLFPAQDSMLFWYDDPLSQDL